MYDFSAIYYEMISNTLIFIVCGMIFFVVDRGKKQKNTKSIILGIVCIVLVVSTVIYHSYNINNPKISMYEGYFFKEDRVNKRLLKREYFFTNEGELKKVFYLDVFSKKDIYPENFEATKKYKIYYDTISHIIVRVEKIE